MDLRHGWRLLPIAIACFINTPGLASPLCGRTNSDLTSAFEAPGNRIAFKNNGGLFNGGVCWWHSRLQRSSVYLAQFDPQQARPTMREAQRILDHLIHLDSVVTIPGYRNFHEFSADFQPLIQEKLNQWQVRDGFLSQQWIRGLYGRPRLSPRGLRERMKRIFSRFKRAKPGLWVMAQYPGITSHALLLIGMKPTEKGFLLRAIDSNLPSGIREIEYSPGDRSLELGGSEFIPYAGFETDQRKIQNVLARHCAAEQTARTASDVAVDAVEVFE
jgi:hypothetical protein